MRFSTVYCISLALFSSALAKRVQLDWEIGYVQINPDGENSRRGIGINGEWPPPVVHVDMGDTLVIHATNKLQELTSLHTHGFFQNGTNYYDGAIGATECGIPPGGSFTYEINVRQTGTYWIHSHNKAQWLDGLRTPLISHPPKEVHKYDEDMLVMLEAFYHREASEIEDQLLSTSEATRVSPFHPYMLVNSAGGSDLQKTKLKFVPGKTYRLRLMNVSGTGMVRFGIEDHEMRVIEVDGTDVEEKVTTSMQMSVGQRVSVLVTAKRTANLNYIYHADIFTDIQAGVARATLPFEGIVEYSPTAQLKNSTESTVDWEFFQDIDLVPVEKIDPPGVHKWVPLEVRTSIYEDEREHLAFNNRTFMRPKVPSLVTALTTGFQAYYPDVYGFKTYPVILDPLEDVEIAIFNMDVNSHPFHLHGHQFFIITRGSVDNDPSKKVTAGKYPVRRDTITVPPRSYALVRFRADNPGVWLFHCHMAYHDVQGLSLTFIEAPYRINNFTKLPMQLTDNCKLQDIPVSGNALGKVRLDLAEDPRGPFPLSGF